MKKKLLYLTSILLFTAASINAQTKVWDFGANALGAGFTDMITVANQTTSALFPVGSLTGGVDAGNQVSTLAATATFGSLQINTAAGDRWRSDNTALVLYDAQLNNTIGGVAIKPVFNGATTSGRLAFNGGGHKTRRYIIITLAAGQTMTMYFKNSVTTAGNLDVRGPGGSNVTVAAYVAGGTADMRTVKITADVAGDYKVGTNLDLTTSTDPSKLELYRIYDADVNAGINLSAEGFEFGSSLDVFSIGNQVYVTNIASATQIQVYSVLGSLVKSVKASENTNFELNSGIYIVKAQSAEGTKTVKVIVK